MEAKKIKVLMIHPEENRSKYDFKGIIENECLDHEYVAAVLDKDIYEVGFWDGKIEDVSCKKRIEEFAPGAAGKIHSDFERGFIRAQVIAYDDLAEADFDYQAVKAKGKQRTEGKEYVVNDGDIIEFLFNV